MRAFPTDKYLEGARGGFLVRQFSSAAYGGLTAESPPGERNTEDRNKNDLKGQVLPENGRGKEELLW